MSTIFYLKIQFYGVVFLYYNVGERGGAEERQRERERGERERGREREREGQVVL